jgi:anti-sigma B factor antagonist
MRFPRGQIDGLAIREMYELTVQLPEHPPPVLIIDLDGLGYMSSGALGMLVNMHRKCRGHGGRMHIVAPSEHLREPFTVTRLDKVLTLHDTMPGPDAPGRNP